MGSLSEEECLFFDAQDDISDAHSDVLEAGDSQSSVDISATVSPHYDIWISSPRSVKERRHRFLSWMGVHLDQNANGNSVEVYSRGCEIDRIRQSNGAVLRKSGIEDEFCSTQSYTSCGSICELDSKVKFIVRDGTYGGGIACDVDEAGKDRKMSEGHEAELEQSMTAEQYGNTSKLPSTFQQLVHKETVVPNNFVTNPKISKRGWLGRLRSMACYVDRQREAEKLRNDNDDAYRVQRVKVHQHGKQKKELSALYKGQEIQAHEGSILTMKFSPDGQYLASAGEDGFLRVWQVLEDERSYEIDIPEIDPSCIYFTVNHLSELKPLFFDKEKPGRLRSMRKTSDSACVIFPPKVFRILDKPLHEFQGHGGEILDISWSKNYHLLSASVDKTVRLWQLGTDHCLRIFSHSNYVTSVQFNPVDNNYFMSGSLDGKVRIWAIPSCQVVDWTDVKEIVTAVCYRPDGQGGIIGSMSGNCRFYNMSESHLQLDAEISLCGKKKSPCKKITGLQYCPEDSAKVMVTCADSQVTILQGLDIIGKYRGVKSAANQTSAYFTSDGKHIVSACEDSNVYLWNCIGQELPASQHPKSTKSYERFSTEASIAVPWWGLKYVNTDSGWGCCTSDDHSTQGHPFHSPASFSLSHEYILESFPKGSATWPEEKLQIASPRSASSAVHKYEFKFLKASCQSTATSHAWGLVIVTAGWDGRIRSFHNYGLPVFT
uniref:WD-repeat protein n=2 Tax=Rhizophora mucronata TaxID=61149 RepID=A0A2P2IV34_RHIMU